MRRHVYVAVAMVALACLAQAEQTIASVEAEVEAKWAQITGFTAKPTTDAAVPAGPMTMKSRATGTLECLKQGEKTLFRLDMVNKIDMGIPLPGALAGAAEQKVLSVFDGKNLYNEMEALGQRHVFKMTGDSAEQGAPAAGKSLFEAFRDKGELKLLPDATVDGAPAYVIEVIPNDELKQNAPTPVGSLKVYISKELGLQIKMEVLDEKGAATSTTIYSEIDTKANLAPERFVYKVPAGVTVQEMDPANPFGKK